MEEEIDDKIDEARRIMDAATARGVTLRLLGGLAIRLHCEIVDFCKRDYSDMTLWGWAAREMESWKFLPNWATNPTFNSMRSMDRRD